MKQIIPWLIFINLLLLPVWIIIIIAAPKCDGSEQAVCKNETKSEASSKKVLLPPSSNQIERAINDWRTSQKLSPFNSEVATLDKAAQARADRMCAENDWSHSRDWEVLDQYYAYNMAGENLYYSNLREDQPADAIKTWANSPTHLENLVKNYSQIGVGVKSCPMFQGRSDVIIITNYFGVPR